MAAKKPKKKTRKKTPKVSHEVEKLWAAAVAARRNAYAPYSKFLVGAALAADNEIVTGCNVENASYGGTMCAERVAIFKAVSESQKKISRLVVVAESAEGEKPVPPCGFCLQVLSEFCPPDLEIWLASPKGLQRKLRLKDLLPFSFGPQDFLPG